MTEPQRLLLAAGTKTYRYLEEFEGGLSNLDAMPKALRAVVDAMTGLGYATPAGRVGYLLNPSAGRLKTAVRLAASSGSVVVVYYSGHAVKPDRRPYYLLTRDSRPGRLDEKAVQARDLGELLLREDPPVACMLTSRRCC